MLKKHSQLKSVFSRYLDLEWREFCTQDNIITFLAYVGFSWLAPVLEIVDETRAETLRRNEHASPIDRQFPGTRSSCSAWLAGLD